jgi:major membrane immunogen (membrane-anchored lipoprotein)
VKGYKDANGRIRDAQEGDYAFAKYNKKVRPAAAAAWLKDYRGDLVAGDSASVAVAVCSSSCSSRCCRQR